MTDCLVGNLFFDVTIVVALTLASLLKPNVTFAIKVADS